MTDAKNAESLPRVCLAKTADSDSNTQRNRADHKPSNDTGLNNQDVDQQLEPEQTGHTFDKSNNTSNVSSQCLSAHEDADIDSIVGTTVISFAHNDPGNPYNWTTKKLYVVIVGIFMVMNSVMGSSLAAGATQEIARQFNVTDQEQLVLPTSIYLTGYVLGPLFFAPLSESYGRKLTMIFTFALFSASTLGCALSLNFASFIVFRFLAGVGASTPISVIGGIYADMYNNPTARGRAVTTFMVATTFGPLLGPIISGFISPWNWRWTFWVALIISGVTWPLLLAMPETYGPVILRDRARRMRQESGDPSIFAPLELEKRDIRELLVVVLTRPIRMFLFEAIVLCSCLYLSFAYGIFYVFFQAFPIIFEGIYGFNAGEEGLVFLPIGVGSLIAGVIYLYWDNYLDKAKRRSPPPAWSQSEEYRRLPLACLGGPLLVISLFWVGWAADKNVHWIVPTLGTLPFGMGFLLLFMALINYLVDAYETFAASAMAAASCSRSIFGTVLPFGARPMYTKLGVQWACSLLGFLSLVMCLIPFAFIKYGDSIRARSTFCQYLKQKAKEDEEKTQRRKVRDEKRLNLQKEVQGPEMMV